MGGAMSWRSGCAQELARWISPLSCVSQRWIGYRDSSPSEASLLSCGYDASPFLSPFLMLFGTLWSAVLGLYTASTGGNIVAATLGALILLFLIGLVRRT